MQRPAPKLLDQLRDKIRVKHYSIRTEHAYVDWARRFILFFEKRHPKECGRNEQRRHPGLHRGGGGG